MVSEVWTTLTSAHKRGALYMKLMIVKYGEEPVEKECDSFEFRTNQVANWIKLKKGDKVETIHGVATIKTIE